MVDDACIQEMLKEKATERLTHQSEGFCDAGGHCLPQCTTQAECASDSYCDQQGRCAPKAVLGTPCTTGNECTSGFCVEGVCCEKSASSNVRRFSSLIFG